MPIANSATGAKHHKVLKLGEVKDRGSRHVEIKDHILVKQVLAGKTDDFRVLVDRYQQPIYRFTASLLGNREEAHDATQEVFLAAFANLSTFKVSRAAFSTWLFSIARNRCINSLKRNRPVPLDNPESVESSMAADALSRQELSEQLDRALSALPVEQRSAFVLAEIEELSYADIARIERASLGAVKSRIHRAKQRLRTLLEPSLREFT